MVRAKNTGFFMGIGIGLFFSIFTSYSQIIITEILASNSKINKDKDFNDYSDWIEIFNTGESAIELGDYFLTDNLDEPFKWQFPETSGINPGEYVVIWADSKNSFSRNIHTNFNLSKDGEELAIFDKDGVLIDMVVFEAQKSDISYGRDELNFNTWFYFDNPTPGFENVTQTFTTNVLVPTPVFSIKGGVYMEEFEVAITSDKDDAKITYTLDGSEPTVNSMSYLFPIPISSNTIIKARAFHDNYIASKIVTQTYIIGHNTELPVISITTDPDNLWNPNSGIYINSRRNVEIPVHIEYFDLPNNDGFSVNAGIQIISGIMYKYPQKPFGVYMRGNYGDKQIKYKIFGDKQIYEFDNLYLRASGNDKQWTMIRDGMITNLVIDEMDIDYQSYIPAILYLNGEYWGIYNIREKINENYIANNYKIDKDNVNLLENNSYVSHGNNADYKNLESYLKNNDITEESHYAYVKSQMDMDEFINYEITQIFIGNVDWPYANIKYWNNKATDSKWRWILYDLDAGFNLWDLDDYSYTHNTMEYAVSDFFWCPSVCRNPEWSTYMLSRLLENEEFKDEFIQRFCAYMNSTFRTERVINIIDSLAYIIEDEMTRPGGNIDRWKNDVYNIESIDEWEYNLETMRKFARNRPTYMLTFLKDKFNLESTFTLYADYNHVGGKLKINNVFVNDSGEYFKNIKVSIEAVPKIGYVFAGWFGLSDTSRILKTSFNEDTTIKPLFIPDGKNIIPIEITEETILSEPNKPYYALGDIVVEKDASLIVYPGVEIIMPALTKIIVYGQLHLNGEANNIIKIRPNKEDIPKSFGNTSVSEDSVRWGAIHFFNAQDTSELKYVNIEGASYGDNYLTHFSVIHSEHSNLMLDNVSINDALIQPFYSEFGSIVIRNCSFYSEETCDYINIKYADYALVEDCHFKGNKASDTDAIDYDNNKEGIIRNNTISGFFGTNSDAIDVGEGTSSLLIENNRIFYCTDKGISIGQASRADIFNNVIAYCNLGIGIKDSASYGYIENNTFYKNNIGIACYEKNLGRGGGSAEVKNTIISNSTISTFMIDEFSDINVSYSLSNTNELNGIMNIFYNPDFVNAGMNNFALQENSVAIDAGDPLSPLNDDGSIADMGAYVTMSDMNNSIIINEIFYESNDADNLTDWIELYNTSDTAIDISGWILRDQNIENTFVFPGGSIIKPFEYILVTKDTNRLNVFFESPDDVTCFGNFLFSLNNDGEVVSLFDSTLNLINSVTYNDKLPWPVLSGKVYASIELNEPVLDNTLGENWHASVYEYGTPGSSNYVKDLTLSNLVINEFMANNKTTLADDFGEYDDWIEVYNNGDDSVDIGGLFLTDDLKNPAKYSIPDFVPGITTVEPYGFVVIWADGDTMQGPLHTNFKLDVSGEEIGLVYPNGVEYIDFVDFDDQLMDVAYGRYFDGNNAWYSLEATPGDNNKKPVGIPAQFMEELSVYPNPTHGELYVLLQNVDTENAAIEIYSLTGKKIASRELPNVHSGSLVYFDLSQNTPGMYLIRVQMGDQSTLKKIILQ